jgi:3,4-dihydroxy 2-butanone 4-phosphate synthase/GTP cyclohydrolase II
VIVEILNDDGTMARRPQLEVFAEKHGVKLGTIADLIEYRNNTETTIERVSECVMPTEYGDFTMITYRDTIDNQLHYALQKGEVKSDGTLVRVHLQDTFGDVLHSTRNVDRTWSIDKALKRIADEDGIAVILTHDEGPQVMLQKVKSYALEDAGEAVPFVKKNGASRQVGVGSQILADLGVKKMKLLSSSTKRYHALSGFGLEVIENITK